MTFGYFSFLIVLILSFLLITALLSRKDNRVANAFLCIVLAAGFYIQFVQMLRLTGEIGRWPYLRGTGIPAGFLIPSCLYLYILALTEPGFRFRKRHLIHFLPFAFGLSIYGLIWYFFHRVGRPLVAKELQVGLYIGVVLSCVNSGIYLLISINRLYDFNREVRNRFSELRRVHLRWLANLLLLFSLPWIVQVAEVLTGPFISMENFLVPVMTIIFLLIGFFGLRQSIIFSSEDAWDEANADTVSPSETDKIPRAPVFFSAEELLEWKTKVERHMGEKKPYLEPELRLVDLAGQLGLKPYQLSEVLNKGLGIAFYDYVNGYRVEEAKRRLLDPAFAHMNILGIANESGFNSKSVFNETFRKYTKTTPSAFRAEAPELAKISPKNSSQ